MSIWSHLIEINFIIKYCEHLRNTFIFFKVMIILKIILHHLTYKFLEIFLTRFKYLELA